MIWEIDDTGEGKIAWDEFVRCYSRASHDTTGFEPRKLATLIEFMMMDEQQQEPEIHRVDPEFGSTLKLL
jgi:hypothetical protein